MRKIIDRLDAEVDASVERKRDANPAVLARDACIGMFIGGMCVIVATLYGLGAIDHVGALLNGKGDLWENVVAIVVGCIGSPLMAFVGWGFQRYSLRFWRAAVASGDRLRTPDL